MRVLHVMEATIGGTRRHLVDVVRGQLARGAEVGVLAACERQPDMREELAELGRAGAAVSELPMVRSIRPALDWRHARSIAAHLRAQRPEIVHTHSSKAGALGRAASLATGIGLRVHTPHTFAFLFEAMFSGPKRALFRQVEVRLGRRTQAIVAVSASEAESFRRSGVVAPERIRVVPNGIDPARFAGVQAASRAELGVPAGAPLALVAGLLNVAKGQDLLLRALAQCADRELHVLVAGSGETEAELRALAAELGIAARVRFLGFRKDVPALIAAADCLVLPSRWEGMPYVVLEAMALAKPVLASAVDGARDLVVDGRTGWLAPIGDPAALARALERMLAAGAAGRAELGRAGAQRLCASYTAEAMVDGLLGVYREVLESARPAT